MTRKNQTGKPLGGQYDEVASKGAANVHAGTNHVAPLRALGYSVADIADVPKGSAEMGLGCGNPTALAGLQPGQVVLDLGSGGGLDAFVAAKKVGPKGRVIGVDATAGMVERATSFALEGGYKNVEFKVGPIEHLPLESESFDVIISNCVINHVVEKVAAFKEAYRVLKPGGELCIADLVVEGKVTPSDDPGMKIWEEWLAAACGKQAYLAAIEEAGFRDVVVNEVVYAGQAMIPDLEGKIISLQIRARK